MPIKDDAIDLGMLSSPSVSNRAVDVDEEIYGAITGADAGRMSAKPIDVTAISPDPTQPRRVVPSSVWQMPHDNYWPQVIGYWLDLAEQESQNVYGRDTEYMLDILLGEDTERPKQTGVVEASLLRVFELAASIRRDGLVNPITITKAGQRYQIETGERRWWAYMLLRFYSERFTLSEDRGKWDKIPARVVQSFDRFRQATENSQRGNLTAIAKARQYALLLMELRREVGDVFEPYEAFDHDRHFYAQVVNHGVPDGMNERLLNACGVKSKGATSKYRSPLKLADEQWTQADDEGLSFAEIEGRFTGVNLPSVEQEKSTKQKPPKTSAIDPVAKKAFTALAKKPNRADIAIMRRWLDELERKLTD